jgi:hypothetical protein
MDNIYVMPHKGVWGINKEKTDEIISIFETKQEAIDAAKTMFTDKDCNIIILQADGTVENIEDEPLSPFFPD